MQVISPWDAAKSMTEAPDTPAETEFSGRRGRLFWLALKLGFLTVLTLGMYRFWMKTRLRRWYWSAFRPMGHPLEYVGDPWEKLLGFLIAVVFLAFYIGVVNLLLMFASFSLFNGNVAAYVLSFIGVIPLWFYASYRARRYVLARTRWRGIRFGLAPGAWGYAGRALWHWFLAIVTLGILWPRKAFYLEKYITDRTYFGAAAMEQGGKWTGLLRPWLGVWLPLVAAIRCTAAVIYFETNAISSIPQLDGPLTPGALENDMVHRAEASLFQMLPALVVIYLIWQPLALINYNVKRLRYLTSNKYLAGAQLSLAPRFWRVTGIYFWGYTLASLVAMILLVPIAIVAIATAVGLGAEIGLELGAMGHLSQVAMTAIAIGSYFLLFLMWSVLMHAFIRFPLMRHYAESFQVANPTVLNAITQRPRDEFGEAEGFAEALDVGAAI